MHTGVANHTKMKKIIIVGIGVFIFAIILFAITLLENFKNPTQNTKNSENQSSPNYAPNTNRLKIDSNGSSKLLNVVKTRPTPILRSDSQIRQELVASLKNESGQIYTNESFVLEYYKAPNSFEARIVANDVVDVKQEVVDYLRGKGLSEDGICKLPLMFTLSPSVSEYLKSQSIEFSPIPDFCK